MPLDAPNAQDNPFRITPNPRFVYAGQLDAALDGVRAAVDGGRDAAIVAEPGMGKTLALRLLALDYRAAFDVRFAAAGPGFDGEALFAPTARGAVLVLLDDAHALPAAELRTIRHRVRGLRAAGASASLALAGRPRLEPAAAEAELMLDWFCLSGLSRAEAPGLVRRRLADAGLAEDLFSGEALDELARRSRGVPRILNLACSNALFQARGELAAQVTRAHAKAAAEAMDLPETPEAAEPEPVAPPEPPGTVIGQAGASIGEDGRPRRGWRALASGLALFCTGLVGLGLLAAHASSVEPPRGADASPASPLVVVSASAAPTSAEPGAPLPRFSVASAVVRYSAFDPAAERAARRAAAALAALGFDEPDVRSVRARLSSSSVRYFHGGDRAEAARANGAVAAALRSAGFDAARVQDLTHYEPRPQKGALEVWIGRDRPAGRSTSRRAGSVREAGFEPVREYP